MATRSRASTKSPTPLSTGSVRIGVIGVESSHVDHFIRHLNSEQRWDAVRVSALVDDGSPRAAELGDAGRIDQVVPAAADLIGSVDAAIISTRDGAGHAADACELLRSGMPLFVDKPFATTVADAQAMIKAAQHGGTVLYSTSPLRTTPEMLPLISDRDSNGAFDTICVSGPADPASPYSGLAFYGIHLIEIALTLCPPGPVTDCVTRPGPEIITTTANVGRTELTLEFISPDQSRSIPFQVEVSRNGSRLPAHTSRVTLTRNADLHLPTVDAFVNMLRTAKPPRSDADLLRSVSMLETICTAL